MILTIDQVGEILDDQVETFPEQLFNELNGGILLLEEEKKDPENGDDMFILGEYCVDEMGRYINIYYGSFLALFDDEPREVWEDELHTTLTHELTHHVEALAGERSLDLKDEAYLVKCKKEREEEKNAETEAQSDDGNV